MRSAKNSKAAKPNTENDEVSDSRIDKTKWKRVKIEEFAGSLRGAQASASPRNFSAKRQWMQ